MNSYETSTSEDRTLAVIAHLAPLIGYTIGFGQILIPLAIYLWKGKESEYVRQHALESLNFQISMTIYLFVAAALMFVLIGFVLLPILGVIALVVMILATIKAANGESYEYPMTIRLVK